jgi:dienelactone hydrolase
MKHRGTSGLIVLLLTSAASAQVDANHIRTILDPPLESQQVVTFQLQQYILKHAAQLPAPVTAQQWTEEAEHIRHRVLNDVVYHGWPQAWVTMAPKFEDLGYLPSGKGYRIRKLRYEIVPGFYSTALLYEPEKLEGRVPAVLNVMGHWDPGGKAMDFEQTFCINQALRGMMALNLEWIGTGELNDKGNSHWMTASLDLVGLNGVGLFYLAMRRGLDYLAASDHVDAERIGVTGLSGGGWQTIVLSSLDPRVKVSIPVAGYGNLMERIARQQFSPSEPGDLEQEPTDFLQGQDYSTLTAMRAPRPTLLIHNTEDTCCYRAPLVRPYTFEPVRPFFKLYGKEDAFQFYANTDISEHNYGLSNREQAYRFLDKFFQLPSASTEIPVGEDIKDYDELAVGVPKDNLTTIDLARKLGKEITHASLPAGDKEKGTEISRLKQILRYEPVTLNQPWLEDDSHHSGLESLSYRLEFSNGLSATGVRIRGIATPDNAPMTIVLNDQGKQAAGKEIWNRLPEIGARLGRGEQVLVVDLVFTGDAAPDVPAWSLANMLRATGSRPLGLEVAQLLAITQWAQQQWSYSQVRLESSGMRSQVEALAASALAPGTFHEVITHGGMRSLSYLLEAPIEYRDAPDLFCLDLYKDFDLGMFREMARPTLVTEADYLDLPTKP